MKVSDFINRSVEQGYEWSEGEHEGKPGYFVGSKKFNTAAHFTVEAIENNDWPILDKQVVQGKNIHHITRIVGYYSRIENWNKSKLGELHGRHEGNYKIEK